jgi:hypothetical protein
LGQLWSTWRKKASGDTAQLWSVIVFICSQLIKKFKETGNNATKELIYFTFIWSLKDKINKNLLYFYKITIDVQTKIIRSFKNWRKQFKIA